ncbi:MAG: hypothetical protein ACK5RV_11820 [Flavobacterium sp.]|jgi:hypothetical protein|uniref:hypothetical protein n=1 Tax=Flavobacterium sp. TaxID=239 RepID=UPI0022BBFF85|nr:hypothetical protein [Flavobacterium sp.]MCZ8167945.1 hypothetical protein [Flavobacterium sp.]MCZ8298336.1 hypothetical protein [Flavobacterium sp.]
MRKEILDNLTKAKANFEEIIGEYSDVLPKNITDGSRNTIDTEIPKFVNNFLYILNASEQKEVYSNVKSVDEAIELFKNEDLDATIEKAIENKTITGISEKGNLAAKEILEASKFGIESGTQLLGMQLMGGKLSKDLL